MVLWGSRKRRRLILAAYTAIAMIGVFTLSSLEPFQSVQLQRGKPVSSDLFMSINHDFLSGNITLAGRGKGYSPSPLRSGFLRIDDMPPAMHGGKALFLQHFMENNESTHHPRIKNAILLKLRI